MSAAMQQIAQTHLRLHPEECARVLERLSAAETAHLLQDSSAGTAAAVLGFYVPAFAAQCIELLPDDFSASILATLPVSTSSLILRQVGREQQQDILNSLPASYRVSIGRVLSFPKESAGALADPSGVTLYSDWTVEESLERLKADGRTIQARIFVLDRSDQLKGEVNLGDLLIAEPNVAIGGLNLSESNSVAAGANAAAALGANLPPGPIAVVDADGKFVGAISEAVRRRLAKPPAASPLLHPLAAVGELYWLGLREVFGGLSSGSRFEVIQGESSRGKL